MKSKSACMMRRYVIGVVSAVTPQAPFTWPFVACTLDVGLPFISDCNIFWYMPLMAGTVTL